MRNYEPRLSFADPEVARRHDKRGDELEAIEFLAALATNGPVLELGIGTGRLAIPLVQRGVQVDGIDFAPEMVARLRRKTVSDSIRVVVGDFSSIDFPRPCYTMIFIAWNTLFNLTTQEDQIRCFEKAARHLAADGCFVLEAYTPAFLHRLVSQQSVEVEEMSAEEVRLSVLRHDPASQIVEQSHVSLSARGTRLNPVVQRYAWPSELDLMARIAGLQLRERWSDWNRLPFDATSQRHVSVYSR